MVLLTSHDHDQCLQAVPESYAEPHIVRGETIKVIKTLEAHVRAPDTPAQRSQSDEHKLI